MNQDAPRPKKILYLITKATWGGAQRYVYDLSSAVPKNEFRPIVAYGERGRLSAMLEEHGVETYEIPSMGRDVKVLSDIKSFIAIYRLLKKERPQVLHVNSSKAAAFGALAGFMVNTPHIIFTAHGWPFKEGRNVFTRNSMYAISWFTAFLAHATIVVSKKDEEIGKNMPLIGHKIQYVRLGIEPPAFLSRDDAWRRVQEIAAIENSLLPRIVTIAELTPNKGVRYGIDCIAELQKRNMMCNYFIIGSGELREALEEYAIEKQVETRVIFCGFIEGAARLLPAFDLFLLPSIKEGMPYVLLEAAAAGLPLVVTDVIDAAFAEAVRAARMPAGNASALADALERTIEAEPREAAPPIATIADMVERTVALYRYIAPMSSV